jgi:hypothetical protein
LESIDDQPLHDTIVGSDSQAVGTVSGVEAAELDQGPVVIAGLSSGFDVAGSIGLKMAGVGAGGRMC